MIMEDGSGEDTDGESSEPDYGSESDKELLKMGMELTPVVVGHVEKMEGWKG